MARNFLAAFLFLCPLLGKAQAPDTEVYLFDLIKNETGYGLENPINISNKTGYDNQPNFISNTEIVFASTYENQTDIVKYNIEDKSLTRITDTPGSEYSPTLTPDGKYISAILLEQDGTQLLWQYPIEGGDPEILIPELKIGYHCWMGRKDLFAFVLGQPNTLQYCQTGKSKSAIVVTNPGRSLHRIPNSRKLSYIKKEDEDLWLINSYDKGSDKAEYIIETVIGAEDMTWMPDGIILMGKDNVIYSYNPKVDDDWQKFASLESFSLTNVTRMDVSPNGEKLAIVVSN